MSEPIPEDFARKLAEERQHNVAEYFERLGRSPLPPHVERLRLRAVIEFDDGMAAQVEMIWPVTEEEAHAGSDQT